MRFYWSEGKPIELYVFCEKKKTSFQHQYDCISKLRFLSVRADLHSDGLRPGLLRLLAQPLALSVAHLLQHGEALVGLVQRLLQARVALLLLLQLLAEEALVALDPEGEKERGIDRSRPTHDGEVFEKAELTGRMKSRKARQEKKETGNTANADI